MLIRKALVVAAVATFSLAVHAADGPVAGRLGFTGQKDQAPQTQMSQAGVTWSVNNQLLLQLMYERTGYAPVMPFDHDDGIMTGIKIRF